MSLVRWCAVVAVAASSAASAEPLAASRGALSGIEVADRPEPRSQPAPRRNALYVEALGKAGLWGVGYDRLVGSHLAFGAVASFMTHGDERLFTVAPYAAVYPHPRPHHRWLIQAGATVAYLQRPSPVPEWPGTSSTGAGANLGVGYEFRGRVLLRAVGLVTVGRGGAAPWLGVSAGVTW